MEKYGVETDEDKAKKASADKQEKCPDCGAQLLPIEGLNVPKCPACGTKPFERA